APGRSADDGLTGRADAGFRVAELLRQHPDLAAQPLGVLDPADALVVARGRLAFGQLGADDALDLSLGQLAARGLCAADPDLQLLDRQLPISGARALDRLGVVDRGEGRAQRRHGYLVAGLDGGGERVAQALPQRRGTTGLRAVARSGGSGGDRVGRHGEDDTSAAYGRARN